MATQNVERVPADEWSAQGMFACGFVAKPNDLGQDVDLIVDGSLCNLLDERVEKDDLGLVVGKSLTASHRLGLTACDGRVRWRAREFCRDRD